MEHLLEKLGWKKFAGIVVVVTLVFLFVLMLSFQNLDNQSVSNSSPVEEERSKDSSQSRVINEENAFEYSNEYYSILYPVQYGVVALAASPPVLSSLELIDDITSNKIQIVVFDREGNTVESLSPPYQNENFQGEVVEQNGMFGYRFVGGLNESHHQNVVLLQKGYSIIRVNLTYTGERNIDIENDFDAIVASLR